MSLQETLLAMARGVRDFRGASSLLDVALQHRAQLLSQEASARQEFAPAEAESLDAEAPLRRRRRASPTGAGRPERCARGAGRSAARARSGAIRGAASRCYREVLVLRDVEGLTGRGGGRSHGDRASAAVKSRLHRERASVGAAARVAPLLGAGRWPCRPPGPGAVPRRASPCSRDTWRGRSARTPARRWSGM